MEVNGQQLAPVASSPKEGEPSTQWIAGLADSTAR
jgi:hypothetical protein